MTDNNKQLLQEIIMMKLSVEVVKAMKLQNTTNRCEAVNRGISTSLPIKNVNFTQNTFERVSYAVHILNNSVGRSMLLKLKHIGARKGASREGDGGHAERQNFRQSTIRSGHLQAKQEWKQQLKKSRLQEWTVGCKAQTEGASSTKIKEIQVKRQFKSSEQCRKARNFYKRLFET